MTSHGESPPQDEDAAGLVAPDLDPFRPPTGYRFEGELQGPTPRPVPRSVRRGRLGRHRFRSSWGALIGGAIVTAGGLLPRSLPTAGGSICLGLLTLLGLVFLAIGAGGTVRNLVARGPYRYVVEGTPIVARVVALGRQTAVVQDGNYRTDVFRATFAYRDPATGSVREAVSISRPFGVGPGVSATSSTYRVGDYATAVSLPSEPERPPELYGFLDLRDGLGLVQPGRLDDPGPIVATALIAGICLGLDALFWSLHALLHLAPMAIGGGAVAGLILGGMGAGGLALVAFLATRPEPDPAVEAGSRLGRGARLFLGSLPVFLGGLIAVGGAFAANALLDRAPAREEAVVIDQVRVSPHRFGVRTGSIRFHFAQGDPSSHDFEATAAHRERFAAPPMPGLAVVRRGRFRWAWVEDLRPAPPGQGPDDPREILRRGPESSSHPGADDGRVRASPGWPRLTSPLTPTVPHRGDGTGESATESRTASRVWCLAPPLSGDADHVPHR